MEHSFLALKSFGTFTIPVNFENWILPLIYRISSQFLLSIDDQKSHPGFHEQHQLSPPEYISPRSVWQLSFVSPRRKIHLLENNIHYTVKWMDFTSTQKKSHWHRYLPEAWPERYQNGKYNRCEVEQTLSIILLMLFFELPRAVHYMRQISINCLSHQQYLWKWLESRIILRLKKTWNRMEVSKTLI